MLTIPRRRRRIYGTPVYHYENAGVVITVAEPAESWSSYLEPVLVFSSITITAGIIESWSTPLAPTIERTRLDRDAFEAEFEIGMAFEMQFSINRSIEADFEQ